MSTVAAPQKRRAGPSSSIELASEIEALKGQLAAVLGTPRLTSPVPRPEAESRGSA